jgi:tetratricopeptide (TPR) repeat protein
MAVPAFQVLLGEVYQANGDFKKALTAVEEGLAVSGRNNDAHHDAELNRLKGEMLLEMSKQNQTSNTAEAERCFQLAINIARRQKARSLELRAAVPLARLWRTIGKKREAHRMLSKIYRWFTEGFDRRRI